MEITSEASGPYECFFFGFKIDFFIFKISRYDILDIF